MSDLEVIVPLGLIGIGVVVFLLWKMGVAPKKVLPYVGGALAAVFGLAWLKRSGDRDLSEKIKKATEAAEKGEEALPEKRAAVTAAEADLEKEKAETAAAIAEYEKKRAARDAAYEREKKAIETSSSAEDAKAIREMTRK